jgi:hypothetical protein
MYKYSRLAENMSSLLQRRKSSHRFFVVSVSLWALLSVILCNPAVSFLQEPLPKQRHTSQFILITRYSSSNAISQFSSSVGESILEQVAWLDRNSAIIGAEGNTQQDNNNDDEDMGGVGKGVYKRQQQRQAGVTVTSASKEAPVWEALASLENDMQLLDRMAAQKPQLSVLEFALLSMAVLSAASGPLIFGGAITNFLAPAAGAFTAAIGIGAEYTGKVAVADSKEVAAESICCAAEAEKFRASAERAKAITPLCVGVGATAASFSLLVPVLLETLGIPSSNLQLITEIYLFCPLISLLASAVAALALQETKTLASRAIGVGNRRFAQSGLVARTWMSSTEMIERKSKGQSDKWITFCLSVLPAPVIGALVPGALPTKTVVVTALAALETAYFLAASESVLSRATDAVALKARSAAVCDTYANQGARSSAILPFTSALSGLCAAATAAVVELPFVEALTSMHNPFATTLHIFVVAGFPALSALFAAAASVSKARCEVDAKAAVLAASTIAVPYDDEEQDPLLRPFRGVIELIRVTLSSSVRMLRTYTIRPRLAWNAIRSRISFWKPNGGKSSDVAAA